MQASLETLAKHLGGAPIDAIAPLLAYASLVETWNRRLNLTGSTAPSQLGEVLFADALVLREIVAPGARFVDVGAGAGAPSIPLLLMRPDLRGTLVEPRRKRVAFMRSAIGSLDLVDRAQVFEQRLEEASLPGAPFDLALSRATFAPERWLQVAHGLAAQTVVFAAEEAVPEGAVLTKEYRLPFSGAPRRLYVYREAGSAERG